MNYNISSLILISLFFIQNISSQTIYGYVYDMEDNPVQLALVSVNNTSNTVYTNDEGYFSLTLTPAEMKNKVNLMVYCMGFEDTTVPAVKNDETIIRLKGKENYLNTVVVTGTRTYRTLKNTPILTKVITSKDLQDIGAVTVLDALESLIPSVHFDPNPMGDNIQIQGLGNNYILVLVDGERVVPERAENVNFSRLNTADIERIEILNGASSVLYGSNAIGAVINIITKKSDRPFGGYLQGRYSKYNTYNLDAGIHFKLGGLQSKTVFNRKSTDGYDLNPSTPSSYTVNPNSDFGLSQTLGYNFNDKVDTEITGKLYEHTINNPPFSANTTHRLEKNYTLTGKVNYKVSDKNILTVSGHRDIFKQYTVPEKKSLDKFLKSDYYYSSIRVIDSWEPSKIFQMTGGYEYNHEQTYSIDLFGPEGGQKLSDNHNLFSQATLKFSDYIEGVAGLRYTHHSGFGDHLSPALSFMYKINSCRLRAGINHGFKAPTIKEMYYNFDMGNLGMFDIIGNPDLRTEKSWYQFVSTEYIKEDLNISATFSHNRIYDKINTVEYNITKPDGSIKREMHYENVEDVRILGIDVLLQWRFLKYFYIKGGYTFSDAKDLNSGTQISGNSKHNITSSLSFKHKGFELGNKKYPYTVLLSTRYFSPRIYESVITDDSGNTYTQSNNSKAFSIWRLVYTQQIPITGRWLGEIQAGVDNLFNYVDDRTYASINPGRSFFIMARISF